MSDFNFRPDYTVEETVSFKTLVSEFENGAEQRRRKWDTPQRKWSLKFYSRRTAETNEIKSFFLSKSGAFLSFTWTNPNDSLEYRVRFSEDSFKHILKDYQIYDIECEFLEVTLGFDTTHFAFQINFFVLPITLQPSLSLRGWLDFSISVKDCTLLRSFLPLCKYLSDK